MEVGWWLNLMGFFFVQLPKGYSGHAYSTSALILLEYILYGAVNTML